MIGYGERSKSTLTNVTNELKYRAYMHDVCFGKRETARRERKTERYRETQRKTE